MNTNAQPKAVEKGHGREHFIPNPEHGVGCYNLLPKSVKVLVSEQDPFGGTRGASGIKDGRRVFSGIAGKQPFTVISIYKSMMNSEVGFVRRALAVLEDLGISFDHIPTGIDSFSVVISKDAIDDQLDDVLQAFEQQLHPDDISVIEDIALIAVVGLGLSQTVGVASAITTALSDKGINIRMLNQGFSEINVIVGVEAKDFNTSIRAIYQAFVKE